MRDVNDDWGIAWTISKFFHIASSALLFNLIIFHSFIYLMIHCHLTHNSMVHLHNLIYEYTFVFSLQHRTSRRSRLFPGKILPPPASIREHYYRSDSNLDRTLQSRVDEHNRRSEDWRTQHTRWPPRSSSESLPCLLGIRAVCPSANHAHRIQRGRRRRRKIQLERPSVTWNRIRCHLCWPLDSSWAHRATVTTRRPCMGEVVAHVVEHGVMVTLVVVEGVVVVVEEEVAVDVGDYGRDSLT